MIKAEIRAFLYGRFSKLYGSIHLRKAKFYKQLMFNVQKLGQTFSTNPSSQLNLVETISFSLHQGIELAKKCIKKKKRGFLQM